MPQVRKPSWFLPNCFIFKTNMKSKLRGIKKISYIFTKKYTNKNINH